MHTRQLRLEQILRFRLSFRQMHLQPRLLVRQRDLQHPHRRRHPRLHPGPHLVLTPPLTLPLGSHRRIRTRDICICDKCAAIHDTAGEHGGWSGCDWGNLHEYSVDDGRGELCGRGGVFADGEDAFGEDFGRGCAVEIGGGGRGWSEVGGVVMVRVE